MANSMTFPKTTSHSRSNSLPSRSHPLTTSVEDHLCRLRSSEATSSSASTIFNNLGSLRDLHELIYDLIHLPSFQRALSHKVTGSDEILEGSLRLLDVCATARDVLLDKKESIQELQSSLRRKGREIGAYMVSGKKINKLVSKTTKCLKTFEKHSSLPLLEEDSDLVAIVCMLREVQTISFFVLKSVLYHVSATKMMSKQRGWSLVARFMKPKHQEVEKLNGALNDLTIQNSCKEINNVVVQNVLKQLQTLECEIQELEEGLEPIYRSLLKTQVSLLNVLNH